METVPRHRTAMRRRFLSRPVQQVLSDGLLEAPHDFFDYGCGRGGDVRHLRQLGYSADGWDPAHAPEVPLRRAAVVNLGFVINVIEDPLERRDSLLRAWSLANDVLVVAARMEWEVAGEPGRPFGDGYLTKTGTFQKFYTQEGLRAWVEVTLGQKAVAAAPGILYVFKSEAAQQRLLARHSRTGPQSRTAVVELVYAAHEDLLKPLVEWVVSTGRLPSPAEVTGAGEIVEVFGSIRSAFGIARRATRDPRLGTISTGTRRSAEARFEEHVDLLQPLIDFLRERGRLPHDDEITEAESLKGIFGSVRAAFSLVRRVTGSAMWSDFESRARQDFLVYLALAAFGGRPKFNELPLDLQYDTRDLCGSYKDACAQADRLLYATGHPETLDAVCRASAVGKLTPEALYVHVAAVPTLAAELRVYIGCAETLTGKVEEATILKLHRHKPQVSFLSYPAFDRDAHPALATSVVARIRELRVSYTDFASRENPPILHRKETLVPGGYPAREKFERLTRSEERAGLLDQPTIGTQRGWSEILEAKGLTVQGHLLRRKT